MKSLSLFFCIWSFFNGIFLFPHESLSQNTVYQRLDSVILIGANEKINYHYNELGENYSMVHYNWSNEFMKYEPDYKYEYSYNNNLLVNEIRLVWNKNSNEFALSTKNEFVYDSKNQLLIKSSYTRTTSDTWELVSKIDYSNTYDDKNRLISTRLYENRKSVVNIREYKYEYTYNQKGNLSAVIYYDFTNSPYSPELKGEFSYNENGILIAFNQFYYQDSGAGYSNWHNNMKDEFVFNTEYSKNQILSPVNYYSNNFLFPTDYEIQYMITEINHDQTGDLDYLKRFYYSPMELTSLTENRISDLIVYPNPVIDYLFISNDHYYSDLNISLIDLSGNTILKRNTTGKIKLSLTNIPNGIYVLKIESDEGYVETRKIIKN